MNGQAPPEEKRFSFQLRLTNAICEQIFNLATFSTPCRQGIRGERNELVLVPQCAQSSPCSARQNTNCYLSIIFYVSGKRYLQCSVKPLESERQDPSCFHRLSVATVHAGLQKVRGYKNKVLEILSQLGLGITAFLSTFLNQLVVFHYKREKTPQFTRLILKCCEITSYQ